MSQPKITGDSVRAYLRDIGRIPLLEHDEEILLGRKVQRLMEINETNVRLEKIEASLLALEQHAKDSEESYDNQGLSLKSQVSKGPFINDVSFLKM